jgi:hypothetical protein
MASRRQIDRYARRWLEWNPDATEEQLRSALVGRFLNRCGHGPEAASAAGGALAGAAHTPDSTGAGCVAGVLLAPVVFFWHLVFPASPTRPEDIEGVLFVLRSHGRWPS